MSVSTKLKWDGVPQLKRTLGKAAEALDDKTDPVKDVIMVPSKAAVEHASQLAPKKTGLLSQSIYATKGSSRLRGIKMGVRKKVYYAGYVEFGTSRMDAHPYFRPAILQMQSTFVADIAPGVKQLLEKTCAEYAYHPTK